MMELQPPFLADISQDQVFTWTQREINNWKILVAGHPLLEGMLPTLPSLREEEILSSEGIKISVIEEEEGPGDYEVISVIEEGRLRGC